jgi:hypothetical protein
MNENEELQEQSADLPGEPAQDLLPDRDVLMMEKPMSDNRAAGYKPADKKLLRNILLILLFLIAALIVLMVTIRRTSTGSDATLPGLQTESVIQEGRE